MNTLTLKNLSRKKLPVGQAGFKSAPLKSLVPISESNKNEEKMKFFESYIMEMEYFKKKVESLDSDVSSSIMDFEDKIYEIKLIIDSVIGFRKEDAEGMASMILSLKKSIENVSDKSSKILPEITGRMSALLKDHVASVEEKISILSKNTVEISDKRYDLYSKSVLDIGNRFRTLEEIMGKIPKDIYEFGAQLSVLSNGILVGITGFLNFKSGFSLTASGLGIDVTATGSATWYQDEIVASGVTGTSFNLLHVPTSVVFLYKNGQLMISGSNQDYTRSSGAISLSVSLNKTDILTATYS